MKIVCDACAAKYSVADEKVAGRTLKVRCKRCSQVLVLRGPMVPDEAETSTLFSLDRLQALARSEARADASSEPRARQTPRADQSGLVDIRALAQMAMAEPAATPEGRVLIGASPSGGPLSGPALLPVAVEAPPRRRGLLLGGGLTASVILGLVLAIVYVTQRAPVAQAGAPEGPSVSPAAPSETSATPPPADAPPAATVEPSAAPPSPTEGVAPAAGPAAEPEPERRARRPRRGRDSERTTRPPRVPERASAPAAPRTHDSASDPLDTLIRQAVGEAPQEQAPRAAVRDLPEVPARQAVERALRGLSRQVRSCGQGERGTATVNFTFRGRDGHVESARVSGAFANTPVGACVQRTARSAELPAFSRRAFNVRFPFVI